LENGLQLPPKANHLRSHLDTKIKNDSFNGLTVQHWPANVHEQGCLFVDGFSAHIGPPGQTGPKILYVFKLISKSTRTDRVIRSEEKPSIAICKQQTMAFHFDELR
jgi:hypothetical protein